MDRSSLGDPADPAGTEPVAARLAAVAHELLGTEDEVFARVARLGADLVPGADHCSVTVERRRTMSTAAASDPLPERIDALQYETDQGPCLEAIRSQQSFEVHDVRSDERWPAFLDRVERETPVRSILSDRLVANGRTIGSLNLYAEEPGAFDRRSQEIAKMFAAQAAAALASAIEIENLHRALVSRDLIETAKGILMVRDGVSEPEAFEILRRASRRSNVRIRDLAAQIVETLSERHSQPAPK